MLSLRNRNKRREWIRAFFLCFAGLTAATCAGCYEKNLAPPLEYDQQAVDVLSDEIENMDWE